MNKFIKKIKNKNVSTLNVYVNMMILFYVNFTSMEKKIHGEKKKGCTPRTFVVI